MIIKTSYEAVEQAMSVVASVISKAVQEDLKSVVVGVKDNVVKFMAYNGNVATATEISAEVENMSDSESYIQLKAKDILDVLGVFKGLKRTVVNALEFHISEKEVRLHVVEGPMGGLDSDGEKFNQVSKYRINKIDIKPVIKNEVTKIPDEIDGVALESNDLFVYINALLPTVAKETRESTSYTTFGEDYVYTALMSYVAIMPNKLDEAFKGFRLSNVDLNFVKNFVTGEESVIFKKENMEKGGVSLTFKNSTTVAVIKCPDLSRAVDLTNFIDIPQNGIVVDKEYLIDVLKRVNLSNEAVFVEVNIEGGIGEFKIVSKKMKQQVPVDRAKGDGNFTFSIRAESLSQMVFSHALYFDKNVFLYFDHNTNGSIVMACCDNTKMWHTKMSGLASSKGNFAWD